VDVSRLNRPWYNTAYCLHCTQQAPSVEQWQQVSHSISQRSNPPWPPATLYMI
jgi:hypothetical protein